MKGGKKFQDTWNYFVQLDFLSGSFVLSNTKKWKWKELLIRKNIMATPIVGITFFCGVLYCGKFSQLLASIIVLAELQVLLTIAYGMRLMSRNRDVIKDLFSWCEKIYDVANTFHQKVRNLAEAEVSWLHRWSVNLAKWFIKTVYFETFLITIVMPLIGFFLPDHIYGKFQLPLPMYLPLKDQDNWTVFLVTAALQFVFSVNVTSMTVLVWGVILFEMFHIYGYLKIIEKSIGHMIDEMEATSDLKSLNKSLKEWIPIVVDMICDAKAIIGTFNGLFSFLFLLIEYQAFAAVFISAFLIVVIKQQQLIAIGLALTLPTVFFIICLATVIIEDTFSDVYDQFYNLPWYALAPRERRTVLQAMTCSENLTGFSAAGMHIIDLERFTSVMNSAYGNFLILKDLVMG